MRLNFQNKYGALALVLVSDAMPVKNIHGTDVDDQHKFDIETAEKIALITDNRGIQICATKGERWQCYVVAHDSPSTAAVARIDSITYVGQNPTQEIRDAARPVAIGA